MAKLPAMHLYTGDWKKDQDLSKCSAATRGAWIDWLCAMHDDDRSGQVGGTIDGLAKIARCTPDECQMALWELALNNAADIQIECPDAVRNLSADCPRFVRDLSGLFPDGFRTYVTVINRRMSREYSERHKSLSRKQKERDRKRASRLESQQSHDDCHEIVTPPLSSSSSTSVPPPTCPHDVTPLSEGTWEGEEGAIGVGLRRRGVNATRSCIDAAKAAGMSPADVVAIFAEFDETPGAYDAGALYQRVAGELAGWPPPSKAAETQKRQAADVAKQLQLEAQRKADAEQAALEARAKSEQESKFGAIVDGLSCDDQRKLLRRHAETEASAKFDCTRVKPGKPIGTLRERLLDLVELEASESFAS
jgi:hypothetical protein